MLKQDDRADFMQAMNKEFDGHESCGHWEVVSWAENPSDAKPILVIWSFKRVVP